MGSLAACLPFTKAWEGGFVDNPKDPGGATKFGITLATLSRWRRRPVGWHDVLAMEWEEAVDIYDAWYWRPLDGNSLPMGVNLVMFDFEVNASEPRSVRIAQQCLRIQADGFIGPVTLAAINRADPMRLIDDLVSAQLYFYASLPTWNTFGDGWTNRARARRDAAHALLITSRIPALSAPAEPAP